MSQETILVADDDELIGQMLHDFLQSRGFHVVMSRDAMQTSIAVRRATPAAILLDIMMPGGSGLEVMKRLKGATGAKKIPVVVMSAAEDPELRQKAMDLGADEFLCKPLHLEEVYTLLCRLLGKAPGPSSATR